MDDDDDGDGATGNEVDDDGDGATGDDNDDDDDGDNDDDDDGDGDGDGAMGSGTTGYDEQSPKSTISGVIVQCTFVSVFLRAVDTCIRVLEAARKIMPTIVLKCLQHRLHPPEQERRTCFPSHCTPRRPRQGDFRTDDAAESPDWPPMQICARQASIGLAGKL